MNMDDLPREGVTDREGITGLVSMLESGPWRAKFEHLTDGLAHVMPTVFAGVDRDLLFAFYLAGRKDAFDEVKDTNEVLADAGHSMMAAACARVSGTFNITAQELHEKMTAWDAQQRKGRRHDA